LGLLKADQISLEDFHQWRVQTASMMFSKYGLDSGRVDSIAERLESILRAYQSGSFFEGDCTSLRELVEKAAYLDAELSRSRACYWIYMHQPDEMSAKQDQPKSRPKYGFPFNSDYMADESTDSTSRAKRGLVNLVISPTVLKVGDSRGENYDVGLVLLTARVICGYLTVTEQVKATGSRLMKRYSQHKRPSRSSGSPSKEGGGLGVM